MSVAIPSRAEGNQRLRLSLAVALPGTTRPLLAAAAGAGFAVVAMAIAVPRGASPYATWVDVVTQPIGLALLAIGFVAWRYGPASSRIGQLLVAAGGTWYIGDLQLSGNPIVYGIGWWLFYLSSVVLAHTLLSFPTGHLANRTQRTVVAMLYLSLFVGQGAGLLTGEALSPQWGNPARPFTTAAYVGSAMAITLTGVTIILIAQRWRRESPSARRGRALFWTAAALIGAVVVASSVARVLRAPNELQGSLFACYAVALMLLGAATLVVPARTLLDHRRVSRLVAAIPAQSELRDALVTILGDPTLSLHFLRDDTGEYVDGFGRPAPIPKSILGRSFTTLGDATSPIAVLVHDQFLTDDRRRHELLRATVAAAGLAIQNARLDAQFRAHLRAAHDIDSATRNTIRAMLHDGAQHRLSALQLLVGQLRERVSDVEVELALARVAIELQHAVRDLREVTEGIYPSTLRDGGLDDALDLLAQRSPVPLLVQVGSQRWDSTLEEAVFFIISEAVGNAHKHAKASQITVSVRVQGDRLVAEVTDDGIGDLRLSSHSGRLRGNRLSGIQERVNAHSGRLEVDSVPGVGTRIRAVFPCE